MYMDALSVFHLCTTVCLVPAEARIGHQIPWNWSYRVMSHHVGAGNQTQVLWKSGLCS